MEKLHSLELNHSTSAATSSALPVRAMGILPIMYSSTSGAVSLFIGVEMTAGAIELTRTPFTATSLALDFVGTDDSCSLGVSLLEFGGTYLAVGVGGTLQLPLASLVEGERHLEGIFVGTYTDLVEMTELVLSGQVVPRIVRYPLEDANRALHDLAAGRVVGRAVLEPGGAA